MNITSSSLRYITREILRYDDPLFAIFYRDIDEQAKALSDEIFDDGRSISLYGTRGVGKTTLMQGILWDGLKNHQEGEFLPVNVSFNGANTITDNKMFEDRFYESVLRGLTYASNIKQRHEFLKNQLKDNAAWIASSALSVAGLVFPPAALASEVVGKGIDKLLQKSSKTNIDSLILSQDINAKSSVDFLIQELENKNVKPVFVVDELDKVLDKKLLSNFFDGQQGWFQEKRSIISLSYTYGEEMEKQVISSVGRISSVQRHLGVTSVKQLKTILLPRLCLGLSHEITGKSKIQNNAEKIFTDKALLEIVNKYIPILYLMLEKSHEAVKNAIHSRAFPITSEEINSFDTRIKSFPTKNEQIILNLLSKNSQTPTEISETTKISRMSVYRSMKTMLDKQWVDDSKIGRTTEYSITSIGDASRHLGLNNKKIKEI